MFTDPTRLAHPTSRVRLKTEQARLTTGRFAAIQVELDGGPRAFVVATVNEIERGWIPRDDRPIFGGLHEAFDAAHREAIRERLLARAA